MNEEKIEMGEMSGAQALMQALIAEGVDTIFGYPGGSVIPIYDALYDVRDKLRHVLVRHEQGAAHAAEGYARASGRVGVCLATSGPGATNLVTGIADAMLDSVPVVFITGQVGTGALGSDAFQETDIISVTIPITKWNYQVTKACDIPKIIAKAFKIAASGRPGPVLVDITKDAQVNTCPCSLFKLEQANKSCVTDLSAVAELINQAKKPLVFVGHGVKLADAEDDLKQLIEKTGIPAACTLHGLSALPISHPLNVGMLGMHGSYAVNMLCNEADLVIAVGMRFDDRVTMHLSGYLEKAKIVHIEIDPAEIDKLVKVDYPIIADAKTVIAALLPLVHENKHSEWLAELRKLEEIEIVKVRQKAINPECQEMRMMEVVAKVSEKTHGEALVVSDVGQHQMCAARYYNFVKPKSFISSGGLGTMGFGLPALIGAKVGASNRETVLFVGDGGFMMTVQELATIVQEKLNVKIVILDNAYLGMVRQWQELFYKRRYSCVNLINPDFVKIAEGFGIKAERIERREELDGAIERMLNHQETYILDVVVASEDNVFPMIPAGLSVTDIRLE